MFFRILEAKQQRKNRIIIVPDVHGRSFWKTVLNNKKDRIVFLGDYSDPYEHEGFTHEDALRELVDIIQFKKDNPERVTLLLGNHDLSYVNKMFRCGRYSWEHCEEYGKLYNDNFDLFQMATEYEMNDRAYLLTHAGVSKGWVDCNKELVAHDNPVVMLNYIFADKPEVWFQISKWRGGHKMWGSPIWADSREHDAIGAFPNTVQIFGHTQQTEEPHINGNMWCLDCRKVFILKNGELQEYRT